MRNFPCNSLSQNGLGAKGAEEHSTEEKFNILINTPEFRDAGSANSAWSGSIMGKYTLIITEKPDAARRIASALDLSQKAKIMEKDGVPYYVARRDKEIVIIPALGHLYTVSSGAKGKRTYPVFNFKWVPRFRAERGAEHIRTWLQVISKLSQQADSFIDACDYDMEGSIIGYCILKYACKNKEKVSRRMKYSTLTKEELEKSYDESLPHLDFALVEAGTARHEIDWLYGARARFKCLHRKRKNRTAGNPTISATGACSF